MIYLNDHGTVDPDVFHAADDNERAALALTRRAQVEKAQGQHLRTFDPEGWIALREQRRADALADKIDPAKEREYKFEEARHLLMFGTHPDRVAEQLHTTREALAKLARRWGADDIVEQMHVGEAAA